MADMADPLEYLNSTSRSWEHEAQRLRQDADKLISRAEEIEKRAMMLEGVARDIERWMPDAAKVALGYIEDTPNAD